MQVYERRYKPSDVVASAHVLWRADRSDYQYAKYLNDREL